ncbi:MAG TPA: permease [Oceanospirillales bacterium]|nr:permease [Oceanospirillales bacterium]
MNFLNNLFDLALDASFWLVIGLFIGGIFKTLIPTALLQKHLAKDGFGSIIKAAILGAPLPLCSCGVIPAAMGLRESGASKSATTSFLVSTPETGVDSVFITYAMMGPFMAIARPIIAILSAITTGSLVTIFDVNTTHVTDEKIESSCCSSSKKEETSCCSSIVEDEKSETSCCSSTPKEETEHKESNSCCSSSSDESRDNKQDSCCSTQTNTHKTDTFLAKISYGVKYAFTELLDNIIFWLVIGLIFAAVVQTFVPHDLLIQYGTGLTGMFIMLIVGIPMYVCATASTPLAAGFLLAGISPGAVIVFLLAGPATNMATLGIIGKQMGKRTMILYLIGIMATALISGFVINYLVSHWNIDITQHLDTGHNHIPLWLQLAAFLLLVFMSSRHFINKLWKK